MPVIAITDGEEARDGQVLDALARLPAGAPVVVMVHGFRYSPARGDRCPHGSLFAPGPAASWARGLGLGRAGALGLGFGWDGCGTIWRAHARAGAAGERLARLLALLRAGAPQSPVHVLAHSLGARVALRALAAAPPRSVGRAILLAAAAHGGEARDALAQARGTEVVNVTARANVAFDLLFRAALPHLGATLAQGAAGLGPGWLDLSLDDPRLGDFGWRVGPGRSFCHWGGYLRPGVWPLYRALLFRPEETPLAAFRAPAPLAARRRRAILEADRRPGRTRHAGPDHAPLLAHPEWAQDQHRA